MEAVSRWTDLVTGLIRFRPESTKVCQYRQPDTVTRPLHRISEIFRWLPYVKGEFPEGFRLKFTKYCIRNHCLGNVKILNQKHVRINNTDSTISCWYLSVNLCCMQHSILHRMVNFSMSVLSKKSKFSVEILGFGVASRSNPSWYSLRNLFGVHSWFAVCRIKVFIYHNKLES
jgi:hypothetical protein